MFLDGFPEVFQFDLVPWRDFWVYERIPQESRPACKTTFVQRCVDKLCVFDLPILVLLNA